MAVLALIDAVSSSSRAALARAAAATRPLCLTIDLDELAAQFAAAPTFPGAAEIAARRVALSMTATHLEAGSDVMLSGFITGADVLEDLRSVAARANADFVVLGLAFETETDGPSRADPAESGDDDRLAGQPEMLAFLDDLPAARRIGVEARWGESVQAIAQALDAADEPRTDQTSAGAPSHHSAHNSAARTQRSRRRRVAVRTDSGTEQRREMPRRTPGPSVKDPEMYEALRDEGASKEKAARISNAAANTSRSAVGRKGATAKDYDERTKAELLQRARDLDIKGRSSMSKAELIDALRSR